MKKLLLLVLVCGLSLTLSASIHVFAGMNANMAAFDAGGAVYATESALGFQGGVSYIMDMGHFMIEPGVRFNTRGFSYTGGGDYNFNAYYADIFGRFGYTISDNLPLTGYAGLSVGFLLSAKDELLEFLYPSFKTTDDTNAVNVGLLVGARYVIGEKFTFGAEYDYGFTDIYEENKGWKGLKFYSANVLLGYLF
ncbi:MAG: PorT family protein [Candidatus Cloacimonetes bacterium]|nr:PorT family protein [Candidatus Cloacimonadota bacterium]